MAVYQWDLANPQGYANRMGRYKTDRETDFIREHLPAGPLRILDVGGGSGRFAVPLRAEGHHVTVCDIDAAAVELLRDRAGQDIDVRVGDFLSLSFPQQFDAVVAIESLQYFDSVSIDEVMERVATVLRPGGTFIFTQLNRSSWRYLARAIRRRRTQPYNVTTTSGYRRALDRAGFSVIDIRGFVWIPVQVTSNSRLVTVFERVEQALGLDRWTAQSPWLLVSSRRRA